MNVETVAQELLQGPKPIAVMTENGIVAVDGSFAPITADEEPNQENYGSDGSGGW